MSRVEITPLPSRFDGPLRALLRGDETAWPAEATDSDTRSFVASVASHGILPLLHDASHRLRDAPETVVAQLRAAAVTEAAIDALRTKSLRKLCDALDREEIPFLVFKGSALARTHYPSSALRPRADHDLLIHRSDLTRISEIVERLGFSRPVTLESEAVFSQRMFVSRLGGSLPLAIDVHWRAVNLEGVADVVDVDEAFERSVVVDDDEVRFRTLRPVDALLVAAIHRAAHHFATDRLIWLADVHLLFERLGPDEERELGTLARKAGVSSLVNDALNHAAGWFGTRAPAGGEWPLPVDSGERAARLLSPGRSRLDDLWFQLGASRSWRWRVAALGVQLFPPRSYMELRYGVSSPGGLFVAWLARIARGARGLLRRR